jgi:arylsulfatase A-like enzyme
LVQGCPELGNIIPPQHIEFKSFLSLAKGENDITPYPNGIYGAYMDSQRMIRKDGFKLIVYPKIKKILLFDLKNDPLEQHNISDQNQYKGKVKNLFENLLLNQRKYRDSLDLSDFLVL